MAESHLPLIGTLSGVTASWHRSREGERSQVPMHVWISIDDLSVYKLHGRGDGRLELFEEPPYSPYDMGEYGVVEIEVSSPPALAAHIGEGIRRVTRLWQQPPGHEVGVILYFDESAVGIANLSDELAIEPWPSESWAAQDVAELDAT